MTFHTCGHRHCAASSLGHHDVAEDELRRLLAEDPTDGTKYASLSHALLAQGRFDEALDSARTGVQYSPDDPFCLYHLAAALHVTNQNDKALEVIEQALTCDPEYSCALGTRMWIQQALGDIEGMMETADRGLAIEPEEADFAIGRAVAMAETGCSENQLDKAVRHALQLAPNDAFCHCLRAHLSAGMGDERAALEGIERALALDPTNSGALYVASQTYLQMEQPEMSLQTIDGAIAVDPHMEEYHFHRGNVLASLFRDEEAMVSLDKGRALILPDSAPFEFFELCLVLREFALAETYCMKRLAANRDDTCAWAVLSHVHCERREESQALTAANRAVELCAAAVNEASENALDDAEVMMYALRAKMFAQFACNNTVETLRTAKQILRIDRSQGHFSEGLVYAAERKMRRATRALKRAVKTDPWRDLPATQCDAALDLLEAGCRDAAVQMAAVIQADHGITSETLCVQSVLALWDGDQQAAEQLWQEAGTTAARFNPRHHIHRRTFYLMQEAQGLNGKYNPAQYPELSNNDNWQPADPSIAKSGSLANA